MDEVRITLRRLETPNGFKCIINSDYFEDTFNVESEENICFCDAEKEAWAKFMALVVPEDEED